MTTPDDLLTTEEVAEILRVSVSTVHRWGREGTLPRVKFDGTGGKRGPVRFRRSDVEALVERSTTIAVA